MTPLIPRDNTFFEMFSQMSSNLMNGARAMVDLFTDYKEIDSKIAELRRIERIGDEMTHNVFTKLNQTFITPFDREDIHELASSLDDVLDFLDAAGARIIMYRITSPPPAALELAPLATASVMAEMMPRKPWASSPAHCSAPISSPPQS